MMNTLCENDTNKSYKKIKDKKDVFYCDAKPVKATADNWADYV